MVKKTLLTLLFITAFAEIYSQTINHPNFGLKSHPTLDIESIVPGENSTTLFMVIENRSLDGSFCADKRLFIILPDGKRLKIKMTEGIPACPETYVFQSYGEKLNFSLTFPELPSGTIWFDLIEDCNEACFSFNSVILDASLNQKIDHAYALIESKKLAEACTVFEGLLSEPSLNKCSYEGAVYWNLIQLTKQMGDEKKSAEWLEMLKNSDNLLKEKYAESLNSR